MIHLSITFLEFMTPTVSIMRNHLRASKNSDYKPFKSFITQHILRKKEHDPVWFLTLILKVTNKRYSTHGMCCFYKYLFIHIQGKGQSERQSEMKYGQSKI